MSELRCSFCGNGRGEVARLIAGPAAHICNECVELCVGVLDDDEVTLATTEGQLLVRFRTARSICVSSSSPGRRSHTTASSCNGAPRLRSSERPDRGRRCCALRQVPAARHRVDLPGGDDDHEAQARTVVDAFGGADRLQDVETPMVTKPDAMRETVLPVSRAGGSLIVAFADPKDAAAVDELRTVTALKVEREGMIDPGPWLGREQPGPPTKPLALSRKDRAAVEAAGVSTYDTAKLVGVHVRTVFEWRERFRNA